ncbi:MAG: ABC transporter permease subunit, partial [Planctomycetota bacterium]|nr:ABC transporter permease subunit [Planctomycetota bacterium]
NRLSGIGHVCLKELRSLFRDRNILVYSVALPAFLYPALLLGTIQVVAYVTALEEQRPSVVEIEGGEGTDELRDFVNREVSESEGKPAIELLPRGDSPMEPASIRDRLEDGRARAGVDAALVVRLADSGEHTVPSLDVELYYSDARGASRKARDRLGGLLEEWRSERLLRRARELGGDERFLEAVDLEARSLSTPEEVSNFHAGLILPLLMTLMIAIGAFYPALESAVGERERGTLETTLLSPVSRGVTVTGKYLAVTAVSLVSFTLNFVSMSLTIVHLGAQLSVSHLSFSFRTLVIIALGAILLAALISALMMLVAFLARSFKEGQTYVSPIYVLSFLPVVVAANPDLGLSPSLSLVPLINTTLLFRESLAGEFQPLCVALTLASSALYSALALWAASRVLRREEVVMGGDSRFLRGLSYIFRRASVARGTGS